MRRYKLLTLTLFISSFGFAQLNSPYTFFGIGEIKNNRVGRNVGMAGVGQAVGGDNFINLVNPAMLANISPASLTYFDFGVKNTTVSLKADAAKQRTIATQLDYFGLALPFKPYKPNALINSWYAALGITQYTNMEYDISFSSVINDNLSVNYKNEGFGGISMAYWTNSFRVADKFYLGLESAYMFGNIEKKTASRFIYSGTADPTTTEFNELVGVSDFKFKPGFAYRFPVNLCRTKKRKDISCDNAYYRTKQEILDECAKKVKYKTVGITSYDTIRTKHLDTLYGAEKKRAEKIFRTNQKLYYQKKIEKCENDPSLPVDEKKYVYKDTLVDAYSLFFGKDLKRLEEVAVVGKNLTLLKGENRVFLSENIANSKQKAELLTYIKTKRPEGYGIIMHEGSEALMKNKIMLVKEIDSLLASDKNQATISNKKDLKDYLTYKSDIYVTLGGSYEFNTKINTDQVSTIQRVSSNGSVVSNDTTYNDRGSLTLPQAVHFGIGLEKPAPGGTKPCGERRKSVWAAGMDFSYYKYSNYESTFDNEAFDDSWKFALGGEITPDPLADKSVFLNRTIYRAGLSYQKLPYSFENSEVYSYGMTFGLSLPMYEPNSSRSYPKYLNLNFDFSNRGYEGGLRENRFIVHVSFVISSKWFTKYKEGL